MKNYDLLLGITFSLLVFGCTKQPTACIEVSPSTTLEVFEAVTLSSCSEEAVFYQWTLEDKINGSAINQYFGQENIGFTWSEAGTFSVDLQVQSDNMKKSDNTNTVITVTDICYSCTNGTNGDVICYSDYENKTTFDQALLSFTNSGFTCTKN